MRKKKQQHHTPRFYLANFTPKGLESDLLSVLDVKTRRWWKSAPQETGKINRFYSVSTHGLDADAIEDYLGRVESTARPVIKQMLQDRVIPEGQLRAELLWFVTLQSVRSPAVRAQVEDISNRSGRLHAQAAVQDRRSVEAMLAEPIPDEMLPRALPATAKRTMSYEELVEFAFSDRYKVSTNKNFLVVGPLAVARDLYPHFWNRHWTLLKAPKGHIFITSDNPVTLVSTLPLPLGIGPGHAQTNTEVCFPLSAEIALVGTFEGQEKALDSTPGCVAEINRRTFRRAYRHVYSSREDFEIMMPDGQIELWSKLPA